MKPHWTERYLDWVGYAVMTFLGGMVGGMFGLLIAGLTDTVMKVFGFGLLTWGWFGCIVPLVLVGLSCFPVMLLNGRERRRRDREATRKLVEMDSYLAMEELKRRHPELRSYLDTLDGSAKPPTNVRN